MFNAICNQYDSNSMNYMNLRLRRTPLPSASPIAPLKKVNYDQRSFNYDLWKIIFDFIHPSLIHLMIPFRSIKSMNSTPHLPLDLVISWNDFAKFDQFKKVLLSFNFRSTLLSKVALHGNYSTMQWFQFNGLTINESVLVSAAQRGDVLLFSCIRADLQGKLDDKKRDLFTDAFKGAAKFGRVEIFKSWPFFETLNDMLPYLEEASRHGHHNILDWYYMENNQLSKAFQRHFKDLFTAAMEGDKMNVLVWLKTRLIEHNCPSWESFVRVSVSYYVSWAASNGNYELVVWLVEQGFHWDNDSSRAAVWGGNILVLKYLRQLNCPWSEDVCTLAAEKGSLDIIKWAKENGCPWSPSEMFLAAAKSNNIKLHQWLFDQNCPLEEEKSFFIAVQSSHFEFLKFVISKGSKYWNKNLSHTIQYSAASCGDLETILWARKKTIQWLMQRERDHQQQHQQEDAIVGVYDVELMIHNAAKGGHLHILEHLRETIPYFISMENSDYTAVSEAAANGHVAILDWAIAKGIDFSSFSEIEYLSLFHECFDSAIRFSRNKVLVWLKTHFPTEFSEILKEKSGNPLAIAAREGDIEVFKWLRNNGAKWDRSTLKAAYQKGHHDIVDWAIMNGCPKGVYKREGKPPARKRNGRLKLSPYRR